MGTLRCCSQIKNLNNILALSNQRLGHIVSGMEHHKNYSKDKDRCCKNIPQTEGRTVEPWPKTPMWPCSYPDEPQPPNYDPYKIKSPEVVVPTLPLSNAKEVPYEDVRKKEMSQSRDNLGFNIPSSTVQNLLQKSHIVHPDNWKPKSLNKSQKLDEVGHEVIPRLGYHGNIKYKYAFHEPWNPLDRLTLLSQAEKDESPDLIELSTNTTDKEMT